MANDIILYFSGAQKGMMGKQLHPNDGKTDDDVINDLSREKGKNPIKLTGWGGTNDSGTIVAPAIDYIIQNSPSDKLIIYGYSAGGMNALHLCRAIFQHRVARDLVDLLVTVDVANGENSNHMDRSVPSNVAINLNFYTFKKTNWGDSHGAPAFGPSGKPKIINRHMPDTNHESIRLASKDKCLEAIRNLLNGKLIQ